MKKLLVVLAFALAACGGEDEDVQPKFDCNTLQKNANKAHTAWQAIMKNVPPSNAVQEYKDKWYKDGAAAKQEYLDAVVLLNKHCK